jgi:hypothetical protein
MVLNYKTLNNRESMVYCDTLTGREQGAKEAEKWQKFLLLRRKLVITSRVTNL